MKYSITPPPELVQQWEEDWHHSKVKHIELEPYIAAQAAQWGADQELEACIAWFDRHIPGYELVADRLRAARRPKPPSLKEQALEALELLKQRTTDPSIIEPLCVALEQLND
jgi:hypothetical protein